MAQRRGHKEVQEALRAGVVAPSTQPSQSNQRASSRLVLEAQTNDLDGVKNQLALGPSARSKDAALGWAAYNLNIAIIKVLIASGASSNAKDDEGWPALLKATLAGRGSRSGTPAVQALIDAKADPNVTNQDGETALMLAANGGNFDTVQILLRAGANPNARAKSGATSLSLSSDSRIISLLKRYGAR